MKVSYIFLIVILLVGGYYWLAGPPNQVAEPETTPVSETTEIVPVEEEAEVVAEESETETGGDDDAAMDDDAVMEFPIPDDAEDPIIAVKEFDLKGFNFGYDVKEIRVKEGDTVTINLTVAGGFHDWVVAEFSAATGRIQPGGATSITFIADKKGTYEYYCSVGSHRAAGMVGTLIVE